MPMKKLLPACFRCSGLATGFLALVLIGVPEVAGAGIVWSGDFSTGNFMQWHMASDPPEVAFFQIPAYGRPIQYGGQHYLHVGDGSLLSLVAETERTVNGIHYLAGPTRGASKFAAKFTIKNSLNGAEPADCDIGGNCTVRRTELTMQQEMMDLYNGMPYLAERWLSFSIYLPSDWDDSGSGWGPNLFQVKAKVESKSSPIFAVELTPGNGWKIWHRWSTEAAPISAEMPWQYMMYYSQIYPSANEWPDGLKDFPESKSQASLGAVNKGGWTDFVAHITFDEKGSDRNGTGFLTIWKRDGSGPWVTILHIVPKQTTRGGMTFNHGIGYAAVRGYGPKTGLYMQKERVWNIRNDRIVYIGNVKVGDQNSTFEDMSPDSSSPVSAVAPPSVPTWNVPPQ